HADLGARGVLCRAGRRSRRGHPLGHVGGDGRAASRARRGRLGADQHRPPGRRRARGRRARLDPGPVLPGPPRPRLVRPARGGAPTAARRPGRPRSARAERAILDAALDLFAESGMAGVCMEAVAARAGVGKATIYRRWPGKEDLLLDALSLLKSPLPEPRGGSVREDLVAMLRVMCQDAADPTRMRRYALLLGEG